MMELLVAETLDFGFKLNPFHLEVFERYYQELVDWNTRVNLTAITSYEDVQRKHFLDSLVCMLAFPEFGFGTARLNVGTRNPNIPGLRVIDVGSGAGFPGVPLKIILPDIYLTLVEATQKKVEFLQHIVGVLQLSNVNIVCGRVEEVGQDKEHREQHDLVLARAVAGLNILAEYCLPLLRVGGRWIAQKGDGIENEISGMSEALHVLGGKFIESKYYNLNHVPGTRHLVVVDKITHTPTNYPRRVGIPSKRPLVSAG
jgi:16S rRNA (guanine527-N7)-methyltransferase